MRKIVLLVIACLLFSSYSAAYDQKKCDRDIPGEFHHYKLAISLSQEWCIANDRLEEMQCDVEFIVHGLWPQCQKGYPYRCKNFDPELIDDINKSEIYKFMPSDFLIRHEWKTHGTCSGLKRSEYFKKAADFYSSITLPSFKAGEYSKEAVMKKIIEVNKGFLARENIELCCDEKGRKKDDDTLDEIRICFSKDGIPIECMENENSCKDTIKIRRLKMRSEDKSREKDVSYVLSGVVKKVLDGDTLIIRNDKGVEFPIRLSDMDTPEHHYEAGYNRKCPSEPFKERPGQIYAQEATNALRKLAPAGSVIRAECYEIGMYGRCICHVFVGGKNLNLEMIKQGWAMVNKNPEWVHDPESRKAEAEAKKNKAGVWQIDNPVHPSDWRRNCWRNGICD
ncbi:thermonuclease family protein [Desulfobacterales bacterium HSG16]|nr:thermonuclease family protein [Desulfobacterales bacterium HSG16]